MSESAKESGRYRPHELAFGQCALPRVSYLASTRAKAQAEPGTTITPGYPF